MLSKEQLLAKVEKTTAVYLEEISEELLVEAGLDPYVMILPKGFKDKVKYIGNLLVQMCFNFRSKNQMLKLELICITTALSYLLNTWTLIRLR
jgi:hypothetical protein